MVLASSSPENTHYPRIEIPQHPVGGRQWGQAELIAPQRVPMALRRGINRTSTPSQLRRKSPRSRCMSLDSSLKARGSWMVISHRGSWIRSKNSYFNGNMVNHKMHIKSSKPSIGLESRFAYSLTQVGRACSASGIGKWRFSMPAEEHYLLIERWRDHPKHPFSAHTLPRMDASAIPDLNKTILGRNQAAPVAFHASMISRSVASSFQAVLPHCQLNHCLARIPPFPGLNSPAATFTISCRRSWE